MSSIKHALVTVGEDNRVFPAVRQGSHWVVAGFKGQFPEYLITVQARLLVVELDDGDQR